MAEHEELKGIAELATEAVAPIEQELRQRLVVSVSDRDSLAIEAALLKAFINGMHTAAAGAAEAVIEQTGALTTFGGRPIPAAAELDPPLPSMDPWADRYGSGG